jgi:hypothetical protein
MLTAADPDRARLVTVAKLTVLRDQLISCSHKTTLLLLTTFLGLSLSNSRVNSSRELHRMANGVPSALDSLGINGHGQLTGIKIAVLMACRLTLVENSSRSFLVSSTSTFAI